MFYNMIYNTFYKKLNINIIIKIKYKYYKKWEEI